MRVKLCGLTSEEQVELAIGSGADAIGLNLVPTSPRRIDLDAARRLASAAAGRALVVVVIADPAPRALTELLAEPLFDRVQLHGHEALDTLAPRGVDRGRLWKAVRLRQPSDVDAAAALPVDALVVDAASHQALGGTGETADWALAHELAARRPIWLAGGLRPDNVALAIAAVRPFGVDVASGVERAPGIKDPEKVAAFVRAAKGQVH